MQLPRFSISRFGVIQVKKEEKPYRVRFYEMEFYTADYPGGTETDGVFRSAKKGYYALYRPGQQQIIIGPYQCYCLNFSTQDPVLCEFFDNLPEYAPVWNIEQIVEQIREITGKTPTAYRKYKQESR